MDPLSPEVISADNLYCGSNPAAPRVRTCGTPSPVQCATGDFWHSLDELAVPGRGPALDLALTYNSLAAATDSPIGPGWSLSYGMHLTVDPSTGRPR